MSHYKLIILIFLVSLGIVLQLTGTIDTQQLIVIARNYADRWWLGILLVIVQTVLFTFALPGSSLLWITAALFPPVTSATIITAGTTLGGVSAYFFSERLSDTWSQKIKYARTYQLLQKQGNFMTLFALRVMPGFPHSVINYSSGILNIKLITFIPAAIAGTIIKSYVYSKLVYTAATPGALSRTIDVQTIWPLFALSILILSAMLAKHYLEKK